MTLQTTNVRYFYPYTINQSPTLLFCLQELFLRYCLILNARFLFLSIFLLVSS